MENFYLNDLKWRRTKAINCSWWIMGES